MFAYTPYDVRKYSKKQTPRAVSTSSNSRQDTCKHCLRPSIPGFPSQESLLNDKNLPRLGPSGTPPYHRSSLTMGVLSNSTSLIGAICFTKFTAGKNILQISGISLSNVAPICTPILCKTLLPQREIIRKQRISIVGWQVKVEVIAQELVHAIEGIIKFKCEFFSQATFVAVRF